MQAQRWNDGWKFWEETNAFALAWTEPAGARVVRLSHDAMLERTPHPDSPNGGNSGYRDGGSYVYEKKFYVSEQLRCKTVQLKFDGVYMNAFVYLNGQLVGKHPYGFVPFTVSLNDYLDYGQENTVRVLVKNSGMPNCRWYSGSGIYRDVWLLTGELLHVADNGIRVSTNYIEDGYASLNVAVKLKNRDYLPHQVQMVTEIYNGVGDRVASADLPLTVLSNREEVVPQTILVDQPRLWSAETPQLYRCVVRLEEQGNEVDWAECEFGIRTLRLDARRGLQVNGQTVKLRGACIHHDNGLLGSVSCDEAELRRVRILKEAGFNAIRSAHNPASPALLRACDKLGLYVMDEAFDMWSRPKTDNDYALFMDKWWQEDLAAMVDNAFNHPSVIFYSLGNEIPESGMAQGAALGRELARTTKELDPTRFVLVSVNGIFASGAGGDLDQITRDVLAAAGEVGGSVNDFMAAKHAHLDEIVTHPLISHRLDTASVGMDLVGYNYMTARYEPDTKTYPNRVMVGSETYPPDIPRNWALVEQLPALIGDFTWTGWDYIGEAGVGIPAYRFGEGGFGAKLPCYLAYCGDIDLIGHRRSISYYREIAFGLRKAPYITVQNPTHYGEKLIKTTWIISDNTPSWTWPGQEGKPVVVEVYSPGTEVELFRNGVSLGRKAVSRETGCMALFETEYQPGILLAISYENGEELGRAELETTGEAVKLRLEAEPGTGELIFVNLTLQDAKERLVMHRDETLCVRVNGGELVGLGCANPKFTHMFNGDTTETFLGRAQAILRRGTELLELIVEAENGLQSRINL